MTIQRNWILVFCCAACCSMLIIRSFRDSCWYTSESDLMVHKLYYIILYSRGWKFQWDLSPLHSCSRLNVSWTLHQFLWNLKCNYSAATTVKFKVQMHAACHALRYMICRANKILKQTWNKTITCDLCYFFLVVIILYF
jgi:hypothetical protein